MLELMKAFLVIEESKKNHFFKRFDIFYLYDFSSILTSLSKPDRLPIFRNLLK